MRIGTLLLLLVSLRASTDVSAQATKMELDTAWLIGLLLSFGRGYVGFDSSEGFSLLEDGSRCHQFCVCRFAADTGL
jgi:hypothetical protein